MPTPDSYRVTATPGGATATGTDTPVTITGLIDGVAYTFTVAAHDAAGYGSESLPSNQVTPSGVPSAPISPVALATGTNVTVTWTLPATNGGTPITGYTAISNPSGITASVSGPTQTSATFTTLPTGTSYTFTVTATNADGTSAPSAASNGVTPISAPGPPTAVAATVDNTQSTVSWTDPLNNGGSAILDYTVKSTPGNFRITVGSGLTSVLLTGLTNGTPYTFTVTARNSTGSSVPSAPSPSVTPCTTPNPPTAVTATINELTAGVTWAPPANNGGVPILSYTATSSPGGFHTTVAAPATTAQVTGLSNLTTYTFTVTATNSQGVSSASTQSNPITTNATATPGPPTSVVAVPGDTLAVVSWTDPVWGGSSSGGIGGSTSSVLSITSNPGTVGGLPVMSLTGATSTLTLTSGGYAYGMGMYGQGGYGDTPAVVAIGVSIRGASSTVSLTSTPGFPVIVSGTSGTFGGGQFGMGQFGGGSGSIIGATSTLTLTSNPGTVIGGSAGIAGKTSILALASHGGSILFGKIFAGATSHLALSSHPGSVISGGSALPSVPTSFSVIFGNEAAFVNWAAPTAPGGTIISYTVTCPGFPTQNVPGTQLKTVVPNLTMGANATVTVAAVNATGTGPVVTATGLVTFIHPGTLTAAGDHCSGWQPTGVVLAAGSTCPNIDGSGNTLAGNVTIDGFDFTLPISVNHPNVAFTRCRIKPTVGGVANSVGLTVTENGTDSCTLDDCEINGLVAAGANVVNTVILDGSAVTTPGGGGSAASGYLDLGIQSSHHTSRRLLIQGCRAAWNGGFSGPATAKYCYGTNYANPPGLNVDPMLITNGANYNFIGCGFDLYNDNLGLVVGATQSNFPNNILIDHCWLNGGSNQINIQSTATNVTVTNCTSYRSATFTAASLTLPMATIAVSHTTGAPTSGQLQIVFNDEHAELVNYTGLTATSFLGCTGGTGTVLLTDAAKGTVRYPKSGPPSSALPAWWANGGITSVLWVDANGLSKAPDVASGNVWADNGAASFTPPVVTSWAHGWEIPSSLSVGLKSATARLSLPTFTGTITTGQTITGMKVNVPSFCPANVTFKNCWLYSTGGTTGQGNHIVDRPLSGLTMIDCELCPDSAVNPDSAGFSFAVYSFDNTATINMTRCYIHNIGEGFRIGGPGLVENVWIDNIIGSQFGSGSHNNCWIRQDNDTGATLIIDASFFWCSNDPSANTTADCLIQAPSQALHPTDFGPVANVTITNNYWHLSSGVQAIMAWDDQGPGISNVVCNNNRFDLSTTGYADPNSHGGTNTWTTSGNSWTNNYVNAPGQPGNQGAPIAANS